MRQVKLARQGSGEVERERESTLEGDIPAQNGHEEPSDRPRIQNLMPEPLNLQRAENTAQI